MQWAKMTLLFLRWMTSDNLFCFLHIRQAKNGRLHFISRNINVTVTCRCKIYLQMLTLFKNRNSWKICTLIFFVSLVNRVLFYKNYHKNLSLLVFKGTLMQIWKSRYMFVFIWKQYPANFTFLILIILKLFMREVCKFLKK